MSIVQYTETEQRLTNTLRTTTEALKQVTAERDALRADAERYRFIHTRPEWLGWDEDFDHRDIDAIVDRAMKGES